MRDSLKSLLVLNIFPLITLLLFLTSCEYKPDEVYEREVNQNTTPPDIEPVELSLNEDTVYFYTNKLTIYFNFRTSNQKIIFVKFTVDGVEKGLIKSASGQFNFDNLSLPIGTHYFKIDVFTHSGSSSIADILEMEGYLFSKTWVLISENIWDMKYKAEAVNGYLKITLPRYRNSDLYEYIISRDGYQIARIRSTEFIDSSYIGEGGSYAVSVKTTSGTIINWNGVTVTKDLPVLKFIATNDNIYSLQWSKSKYYSALERYYILQRNFSAGTEKNLSLLNPDDTVLSLPDLRFNDNLYFNLRSVPREVNPIYSWSKDPFEAELRVNAGIPFNAMVYNEGRAFQISEDEFVYTERETLYRCSVTQNKILESRGYPVSGCVVNIFKNMRVSPNGENIVVYVGCKKDIFRSSAFNFQSGTLTNLTVLSDNLNTPIAVSDVGTGIVITMGSNIYLYDFLNSQIIGNIPIHAAGWGSQISSDGSYLLIPSDSLRYFKFSNGQFNQLWKSYVGTSPVFYSFGSSDTDKLALWINSVFYLKKCSDFSTINEFNLSVTKIFNVDFHKNQLLAYHQNHLYVISIIDGTLLYDIPINFLLSSYAEDLILINNTIICRTSVLYKLN